MSEKSSKKIEKELTAQIKEAQAKYHDAVQTLPQHETAEIHYHILGLRQELADYLSDGALPCPFEPTREDDFELTPERNQANWEYIRHKVIGMKKTDDPIKGIEIYEVGCLTCNPKQVEAGDTLPNSEVAERGGRLSVSARAGSRDGAVENWNDREFVLDNFVF